jgi:hypothetical protein
MFNGEYISQKLQEARRRDLLEEAERSRLAAVARVPQRLSLRLPHWRWHRRTPVARTRPCGSPATR